KQLLPLAGNSTMFQDTARRVGDPKRFTPPLVVCNDEHRFIIAEQLRQLGIDPFAVMLETEGRNTAPAAAAAALALGAGDAVMLVLPSDHVIADQEAFLAAVEQGAAAARQGALVTFGIKPDAPETGYGYIQVGAPIDGVVGSRKVARFVEKPTRAKAEDYLRSGEYLWNSGIFMFRADAYLAELARVHPEIVASCRKAVDKAVRDSVFLKLDPASFGSATAKSIDYAVMEHTTAAAVVPVDMGWNDVGSWSALWSIGAKDSDKNVVQGDVIVDDTENCYIRSSDRLVAAVGLRDTVIVETDDAVLVAAKDKAQDVKAVVDALKAKGRTEHHNHSVVHRPWGTYQTIDLGTGYQVKRITVKPGAKLSLQKHAKRAEHWVVVNGTAKITRNDEVFELKRDGSTYIPLGAVHRLENVGKDLLELIEVQSGDYLGEDDIVRLEDTYGRS
ncbi:MAG: mannose-1-phosphate guanylyltransferase/mannose-6-phosphate isomerase, partial [Candidatus Eiseniibacteriota bacterium]